MKKRKVITIIVIVVLSLLVILEALVIGEDGITFKKDADSIQTIDDMFVKIQNEHVDLMKILDKGFEGTLTQQDSADYQKLLESSNALVSEHAKFIESINNAQK